MTARITGVTMQMERGLGSAANTCRLGAAEKLLEIGVRARLLARREPSLIHAATALQVCPRLALLGILFVTSPDTIKLRAMVEEWTLLKILGEIRKAIVR